MFEVHSGLNVLVDTLPRSRASQEADWPTVKDDPPGMARTLFQRRSSCLLFQMFGVETCSFLPDDQCDRGNLPRQGEASHRWLHPLGKQSLAKMVKRSTGNASHCGGTLEDIFEVVVMVRIQSPKLLRFLGALQLSFDIAVLRTVVRLQSKTAGVRGSAPCIC